MEDSHKTAKKAEKPYQQGFFDIIFEGPGGPQHVGADRHGNPAWVRKKAKKTRPATIPIVTDNNNNDNNNNNNNNSLAAKANVHKTGAIVTGNNKNSSTAKANVHNVGANKSSHKAGSSNSPKTSRVQVANSTKKAINIKSPEEKPHQQSGEATKPFKKVVKATTPMAEQATFKNNNPVQPKKEETSWAEALESLSGKGKDQATLKTRSPERIAKGKAKAQQPESKASKNEATSYGKGKAKEKGRSGSEVESAGEVNETDDEGDAMSTALEFADRIGRPLIIMYEDDEFTMDQLQWLSKTALRYQQRLYSNLSSRLFDKYGLHVPPERIQHRFENVSWENIANRVAAVEKKKKARKDKQDKRNNGNQDDEEAKGVNESKGGLRA